MRTMVNGKGQAENYRELLEERRDNPCTPDEQRGAEASREGGNSMALAIWHDIVDELADQLGIYGAHDEENDAACETKPCRVCWTSDLTERIWAAVRIEQDLEQGRVRH